MVSSRPPLEQPAHPEEREPGQRQLQLGPHVVLKHPRIEGVRDVRNPDGLQAFGQEEEQRSPSALRVSRAGPQMLMLKYAVLSDMMYLMFPRCRSSIFTTNAHMFTTRKPVSAKRAQPQRAMNSSKSAPLIALHM